jgi:predicted hydrocarbon binding protein
MATFTEFFRDLHQEMQYQPSNAVFLYVVGKNLAKRNKNTLLQGIRQVETNRDIAKFISHFKKSGIGTLKLVSADPRKKEFYFELKNSVFKTGLKRPSCSVVGGMLASLVEETYGFYAGALETACVSQGDRQCEFKVKIVGKEPLR